MRQPCHNAADEQKLPLDPHVSNLEPRTTAVTSDATTLLGELLQNDGICDDGADDGKDVATINCETIPARESERALLDFFLESYTCR